MSAGVQRRTWQGAGIGFLAGGGIGAVVGLATYHRTECIDSQIAQGFVCPFIDDISRQTSVIIDAALIGTAGTIVGALIGHVAHETWIPVSLTRLGDARARIEVRRVAGLIGIGAGLQF